MRYLVDFSWNGTPVMRGVCTETVTRKLIQTLILDSFIGDTVKRASGQVPTLEELVTANRGRVFCEVVSDETGQIVYRLECLSDAGQ